MKGIWSKVKEFNMLIWMTQLGISVAVPLALCILGAVWLRNRFDLGPWVLILGICLGFYLAVDGLRTSLKAMDRMHRTGSRDKEEPPMSFNDHL